MHLVISFLIGVIVGLVAVSLFYLFNRLARLRSYQRSNKAWDAWADAQAVAAAVRHDAEVAVADVRSAL